MSIHHQLPCARGLNLLIGAGGITCLTPTFMVSIDFYRYPRKIRNYWEGLGETGTGLYCASYCITDLRIYLI